jgi:hypothetical protein
VPACEPIKWHRHFSGCFKKRVDRPGQNVSKEVTVVNEKKTQNRRQVNADIRTHGIVPQNS